MDINNYKGRVPLKKFTLTLESRWFISPLTIVVTANEKQLHNGEIRRKFEVLEWEHDIRNPLVLLIHIFNKEKNYTTPTQDHAIIIDSLVQDDFNILPNHPEQIVYSDPKGYSYVEKTCYMGYNGTWQYVTPCDYNSWAHEKQGKGEIY